MDEKATGERALLLAMLERAIVDAAKPIKGVARETRREALQWVKYSHPSDINTPFTYLWVCSHLEICPHKLREYALECIKNQDAPRFTSTPLFLTEMLDLEDDAEHHVPGLE